MRSLMVCLGIVVAGVAVGEPLSTDVELSERGVEAVELPDVPTTVNLDVAQRYALRENPSLKAAEQRVEQAAQRLRQARSEWFPRIDVSGSASVTELSERDEEAALRAARGGSLSQLPQVLFGQQGSPLFTALSVFNVANSALSAEVDDTAESFQASLTANWLVFDGFGRKFRIAAARYGRMESEAAYREAQRLLLSAIANAYYNVQLARENIAIAKADESFNQRQLKEAKARRRVGAGSLSDVLNFRIRVRAAQSSVFQAERAYNVALIALGELMGLDEAELPEEFGVAELRPEESDVMAAPEVQPLVEYAMESRPDLEQAEATVNRADASVGANRSAYFPRVSAFASRDAMRSDSASFDSDDFSSTIGLNVSYNLFSGGQRRASLREAKAFRSEAEYSKADVTLSVAAEVRTAAEDVVTAQKDLVLQRETTELVERNRSLVEKEYQAGQGSLVRLNEAQRDLISQQSQLALARVQLRQSWHDLRTATAETLEMAEGEWESRGR